jgi:hypothetical protein
MISILVWFIQSDVDVQYLRLIIKAAGINLKVLIDLSLLFADLYQVYLQFDHRNACRIDEHVCL